MSRKQVSKAVQLITNFNNGNYHTENKKGDQGIATKMTCRLCGRGRETGWHLLTDCHPINDEVRRIFTTQDDWKVKELAQFLEMGAVSEMLDHRIDLAGI